ncbi:MAG: hypothetical protein H0U43_01585 [Chthoniobacterales bacterium]|nr:hypothetical protein [Chthoniobacterales bacterium]
MRLESQLAISESIRSRLFSVIRANFQPTEPEGYSAVRFQVSGTVDRPKTNLMDKVVGGGLNDLGGVIDSLLGGKKNDAARKARRAEQQRERSQQPEQPPPAAQPTEAAPPDPTTSPTP